MLVLPLIPCIMAGLSSVSSASSSSGGSYRGGTKLTRPVALYSSKRLPPGKKVRYTVSQFCACVPRLVPVAGGRGTPATHLPIN